MTTTTTTTTPPPAAAASAAAAAAAAAAPKEAPPPLEVQVTLPSAPAPAPATSKRKQADEGTTPKVVGGAEKGGGGPSSKCSLLYQCQASFERYPKRPSGVEKLEGDLCARSLVAHQRRELGDFADQPLGLLAFLVQERPP